MNIIFYIVVGVVIGFGVGWAIINRKKLAGGDCCAVHADDERGIKNEQEVEKEKNLERVRQYIAGKEKVTNAEIQKLLNISNATVARYFNDLEKEGVIRQMGDAGQNVYYDVIR